MRPPPRLIARVLVASFSTVVLILLAVFALVSVEMRDRVRQSAADHLEAGQRAFARLERERQQNLLATVSTLAENPTLKAALDTWQTEERAGFADSSALVATVQRELAKIAARIDVEVLAAIDHDGRVIASAGPRQSAWPPAARVRSGADAGTAAEFLAQMPDGLFRATAVPLVVNEAVIGALAIGRAFDSRYAEELAQLARGHSAILLDGRVLATTLPAAAAAELAAVVPLGQDVSRIVTLAGESYAVRRIDEVPPAAFLTLASIDAAASAATRAALGGLAWIAAGALLLAALGSFWLSHAITRPIDQLSASITAMTVERRFDALRPTGTSRELDALAESFNKLMRALGDAEAQTQAAYLGAIRALAAALDARDPYTAGHSERVSALSVEMGRALALSEQDLDTLRLGALLHDIGKIGVPDEVLGKPGTLSSEEFELIRAHPVIGARILRSIPFLAPHLPIVELHHERLDGRGYPYGLAGDAIPLAARIVHVADAYDAITSARAYRPRRLPHEALAELKRGAGTDFDRSAVQALVHVLPTLPALPASFDPNAFHFGSSPRAGRHA